MSHFQPSPKVAETGQFGTQKFENGLKHIQESANVSRTCKANPPVEDFDIE